MRKPRILIVSSKPDWHGQRLIKALTQLGADPVVSSLESSGFALDGTTGHGLGIPELKGQLPDAVIVRTVGGGTFEQVTTRLSILHALVDLGVTVYNPPRAVERCVDKSMTSFLLAHHGLPTPPTWTTESLERAKSIVADETAQGHRIVFKPLFGAQGIGLKLLDAPDQLDPLPANGLYYLQRYIPPADGVWRDWRVLVVGGKAVAAMMRLGKSWITNVRQGAACVAAPITPELSQLSVAAADAVGALYAGVDLVMDGQGRYSVIEVNSMPAWRGLQSVTEFDIAGLLAQDVIRRSRQSSSQKHHGCA